MPWMSGGSDRKHACSSMSHCAPLPLWLFVHYTVSQLHPLTYHAFHKLLWCKCVILYPDVIICFKFCSPEVTIIFFLISFVRLLDISWGLFILFSTFLWGFLYIYLFFSHILTAVSCLSSPSSPSLTHLPLPQIYSSSISLQEKKAGIPGISTKHGITNCNKTRHISSYQCWTRKSSRMVTKVGKKKVRDSPHSLLGVTQECQTAKS